ncbi:MAG: hypothetical protein Q7S14_00095 [bacterium]|nr:hypothetical protein [bacterium]
MQRIFLFLIFLAATVNLVGVFQPEMGFDALWYHLTIPKLYLTWEQIKYIPGGLLYYSAMPKLGELFYLLFGANDIFAHLINWGFGIGIIIIIHKISKNWLAPLIFYATPIVGWLSGSAYIDLIRTFFEVLAFYCITKNKYIFAGIAIALAVGTKTFALGSIPILLLIIILKHGNIIRFLLPAILFSAPWFIVSYLWTGNPIYPIGMLSIPYNFPNPLDLVKLFTTSSDPISPIYLIILPLIISKPYVFLTAMVWLLIPRTDWGRFMLPYLPVWAIYSSQVIKKQKWLIYIVIFISIVNIGYRIMAQKKIIPYLLKQQTKTQYLCQNLDFNTSVFVDCDGWFAKNLKPGDLVLVSNVHNLYYINFPFVHESWYTNEPVTHVLTYNKLLDKKLVYENEITGKRLYVN